MVLDGNFTISPRGNAAWTGEFGLGASSEIHDWDGGSQLLFDPTSLVVEGPVKAKKSPNPAD
jgi:hypothetical protein